MKLDDLENARKAQKKSDRHFYFDRPGSIKYYGRASSDDYVEYIMLYYLMNNVKSLRKKASQ